MHLSGLVHNRIFSGMCAGTIALFTPVSAWPVAICLYNASICYHIRVCLNVGSCDHTFIWYLNPPKPGKRWMEVIFEEVERIISGFQGNQRNYLLFDPFQCRRSLLCHWMANGAEIKATWFSEEKVSLTVVCNNFDKNFFGTGSIAFHILCSQTRSIISSSSSFFSKHT